MPVEASSHRPPTRPATLTNSAYELASSNSTSSHFLGSTQRSWMTGIGGGGTGSTATRRVSGQTVNKPTQIHHSHQSRVPNGREANTTSGSDSNSDNFTALTVPAKDHAGTPSTASIARSPILIQSPDINHQVEAVHLLQDISSRQHRLASETPTHNLTISNPTPTAWPPQTSTASVSGATGAPTNLPSLQTSPQPDWQRWQTADALRFSAALATSPTPNMTTSTQRQLSTIPSPVVTVPNNVPPLSAAAQFPTLMTPVSVQAAGLMSRKRPNKIQDEERRTRSRSDDPTVSQIPTPVATPTLPSNTYSTQFERSLAQLRKEHTLNRVDSQRIGLLQEACDQNDILYLWIHHVYSVAHVNRKALNDLNFGHPEYIGLAVLEPILMHNNHLSFGALSLFTNFPHKSSSLLEASNAHILLSVRGFLSALGLRWKTMCDACRARGHPPSAIEILFAFSVTSPIMQKTLFNSIHRQVSGADNLNEGFAHRAVMLFSEDQSQAGQFQGILTHDLVIRNGERFGQRYLQLKASAPPPTRHQSQQRRASAQSPLQPVHGQLPHLVTQQSPGFVPSQRMHPPHRAHPQIATPSVQAMPPYPPRPAPTTMQQIAAQHVAPNNSPYPFIPNQAAMHINPQITQHQLNNYRRPPQPSTLINGAQSAKPDDPLLPPPGYPVSFTTNPNPDRLGLHQAHLRSPMPRKLDVAGMDQPDLRLYQYVKEFVLPPQKIDAGTRFVQWHFDLSQAMLMQRAVDIAVPTISTQNMRLYRPGSVLFRLKAVSLNAGSVLEVSNFNALPTSWPHCCFVSINDCVDVEFRRRQHHARDLPADLTRLVRPGHNVIQLSNHSLAEEAKKDFYFAVELIHFVDHTDVASMPSHLSAKDSLAAITSALTSSQDDELSFTDPFVSIDLVDPFMATMWRQPVRGKLCKHRECFDLQAFLLSRTSKMKEGPTNPDQWLCPICKKDARPANLVVDDFLRQIRDVLEEQGNGDARAILVRQDGRWEAKIEKEKGKVDVAPKPGAAVGALNGDATASSATASNSTGNLQQDPGLGIDLDGMAVLAAYNATTDEKENTQNGASGSATPAATATGTSERQTPVATMIIEIDDDD